jgi:hypothetical protein
MSVPSPQAPPDHPVTLNYGVDPSDPSKTTFTANPRKIQVKPGQTIGFKLGAGPSNGKIRVTFKDSDTGRFLPMVFEDGGPHVEVRAEVEPTTYSCELLVNNQPVAQSGDTGGEIEPAPRT